jgi:uncharacterized protein YkwD
MRRFLVVLAVLALIPAGSAVGSNPPGVDSRSVEGATRVGSVSVLEGSVVAAINVVRRENGLRPLRLNRRLSVVARDHSLSMAEHGYFSHTSLDGAPFWARIKPVYPPVPGRTWSTGENMVWQSPELTAAQVVDLWLHSSAHRKNLLASRWREVGVGGVRADAAPGVFDGLDVTIVTADFGVR